MCRLNNIGSEAKMVNLAAFIEALDLHEFEGFLNLIVNGKTSSNFLSNLTN